MADPKIVELLNNAGVTLNGMISIDFLYFHNIEYRIGLNIVEKNTIYEIIQILSNGSDYWLICLRCEVKGFDKFLNSIQIERKDTSYELLKHSELINKTSYEHKYIDNSKFIQSNTLVFKYETLFENRST